MNVRQGFTLVEIMVTIVIIGILATITLIGLGAGQKSGRDAKRIEDLRNVQHALEVYYNINSRYPPFTPTSISFAQLSYTAMGGILKTAGLVAGTFPNDSNSARRYGYQSNSTIYWLGAVLEGSPPSGYNPPGSIPATFTGMTLYCAQTNAYCVSL